jgi:hypothetical protein
MAVRLGSLFLAIFVAYLAFAVTNHGVLERLLRLHSSHLPDIYPDNGLLTSTSFTQPTPLLLHTQTIFVMPLVCPAVGCNEKRANRAALSRHEGQCEKLKRQHEKAYEKFVQLRNRPKRQAEHGSVEGGRSKRSKRNEFVEGSVSSFNASIS